MNVSNVCFVGFLVVTILFIRRFIPVFTGVRRSQVPYRAGRPIDLNESYEEFITLKVIDIHARIIIRVWKKMTCAYIINHKSAVYKDKRQINDKVSYTINFNVILYILKFL